MTQLQQIVTVSAQRGLNLQLALRGVLVVFVVATLTFLPPGVGGAASWWVAGGYVMAAIALTVWLRTGTRAALNWGWLGLYLDLAVLLTLNLIAQQSAGTTWTSYVLQSGFFLIPILAATQLRWGVCASVVIPTVALYALEVILTQRANENEPWPSIILRVVVLAGVGLAAVWLSRIQRSRVGSIRGLVDDRTRLLTELMTSTETEHRAMAENLHDGALQYVLAARMDLEDARDGTPDAEAAFDRLDDALTRTAQLLRSTVSELHPAVLEQSGLALAIGQLAATGAERGDLTVTVDTAGWPDDARTDQDRLLFAVARELISNVVRHAHASRMTITLALHDGRADLTVSDDGVGFTPGTAARKLSEGHIGVDSQRVKVEAAGGRFQVGNSDAATGSPASPSSSRRPGATVRVTVPLTRTDLTAGPPPQVG
ncbi:ATP-binding protein [Nakamurella sp.]|uniref:sensor histidine kinase n=1 Tax=Nakamurella sp. TaxID=1869182 RepID=UPI0037833522